jgi:hypothetical protein
MNNGQGIARPKGPLPLQGTPSFNFKVQEGQGNGKTQIQIQRPQTGAANSQNLVSPWDAKVSLAEGPDLKAYILDHGNGLKSTIAFEGTPVIQDGQSVKAGAKLALLDPSSRDIYWNIEKT